MVVVAELKRAVDSTGEVDDVSELQHHRDILQGAYAEGSMGNFLDLWKFFS